MKIQRSFKKLFYKHFEWVALSAGLLAMALLDPFADAQTLCPLERVGFEYCPGEGLGRSVSLAFRGDLMASFSMHPAGVAAVLILSGRIITIWTQFFQKSKTKQTTEQ